MAAFLDGRRRYDYNYMQNEFLNKLSKALIKIWAIDIELYRERERNSLEFPSASVLVYHFVAAFLNLGQICYLALGGIKECRVITVIQCRIRAYPRLAEESNEGGTTGI